MLRSMYQKAHKPRLYGLGVFLLFLLIVEIVMTCVIPMWRSYFYDILQNKDQALFATSMVYFILVVGSLGMAQGLKQWVSRMLSFELRQAGTKVIMKPWTKLPNKNIKNYTQAMTESLRNSTELFLDSAMEIFISGFIVIVLLIQNLHNTMIVLAALGYTVVVSILALVFNKPMIRSDRKWQESEGTFREALSDIAKEEGDYTSKEKFKSLAFNYYRYIKVVMGFTLFTRMKGSLGTLVPYALLASSFFAGTISLGDFMGAVSTFELIVVNSTILLIIYPNLNRARASYAISKKFFEEVQNESIKGS